MNRVPIETFKNKITTEIISSLNKILTLLKTRYKKVKELKNEMELTTAEIFCMKATVNKIMAIVHEEMQEHYSKTQFVSRNEKESQTNDKMKEQLNSQIKSLENHLENQKKELLLREKWLQEREEKLIQKEKDFLKLQSTKEKYTYRINKWQNELKSKYNSSPERALKTKRLSEIKEENKN
ncbi:kinetochore protein sos7 [Anaeramoeba ignava]|uniref:Kinetochore protein sos7 n=1 Tax=Anaeramoeba ignava TaxID=1746090 RepID=A0A9Q0L6A9_ANAIG|nr:kinetochore protein sos7 [Anaeramoeba ignava]